MAEILTPSFLIQPTVEATPISVWPTAASLDLRDELHPIPSLHSLDHDKPPMRIALGWHPRGLAIAAEIRGKTLPPKSEPLQNDADDRFTIGIDTRDTKTIHRAGKFCHRFHLTPGDELGELDPSIAAAVIPRATQDAPIASFDTSAVAAEFLDDGYRIVALVDADALNGFDPSFSDRIGLHVQLHDRELGIVPYWGDPNLPGSADPSLWASVKLQPQ